MIGRPLSCDEQTYNYTRLEYVRVCMEIDATLPYVQEFEIDSPLSAEPITVIVDYEWKPSCCDKCKVFCHSYLSIVTLQSQPTKMDKGKGIADIKPTSLPNTLLQTTINPPLPIPTDLSPSSAVPSSSRAPPPTQCIHTHMTITTTNYPLPSMVAPSSSNPSSPMTLCPKPFLDPQLALNTIPTSPTITVGNDQPDIHVPNDNNSCHESGNDPPTNIHTSLHPIAMDTAPCQESRMDSLGTTSESSHTAPEATVETSSTFMATHDVSPNSSPKIVWKKKGARNERRSKAFNYVSCFLPLFDLMFNIGSWNTWGLNSLQKQNTVHHWMQKNNLDIFSLFETKIEVSNLAATQDNLAPSCWHYISNIHHTSHCRILVGWNSHKLNLIYEDSSPQ